MTGSGNEEVRRGARRATTSSRITTRWFKPNNATMIVVGDTTLAEIRPKLETLFARWRPGEVPGKVLPDVALPAEAANRYLIDRPGLRAERDHRGPADRASATQADDIAIDAMNDILGGAFTSRVNMNLREDKGWSYGADTSSSRRGAAAVPRDRARADRQDRPRRCTRSSARSTSTSARRRATAAEVATSKRRSTLTLPGRWETARAVARDIARARALRPARRLLESTTRSSSAGSRSRRSTRRRERLLRAGPPHVGGRRRSRRHRGPSARARHRRGPRRRRGRQRARQPMNVL